MIDISKLRGMADFIKNSAGGDTSDILIFLSPDKFVTLQEDFKRYSDKYKEQYPDGYAEFKNTTPPKHADISLSIRVEGITFFFCI